jgi:hypothetical protein
MPRTSSWRPQCVTKSSPTFQLFVARWSTVPYLIFVRRGFADSHVGCSHYPPARPRFADPAGDQRRDTRGCLTSFVGRVGTGRPSRAAPGRPRWSMGPPVG